MAYAKITQVLDNRVKVKLNSDNVESQVEYYYMAHYEPKVDDVVVIDTKLRVVLGKVVLNGVFTLESRVIALETINL